MKSKDACELLVDDENKNTSLPLHIAAINTWYKRYYTRTLKSFCKPFMSNAGGYADVIWSF
jgi:hypothetical protein